MLKLKNKKKVVLICPFSLDSLTGTPNRTIVTARAINNFHETIIISQSNNILKDLKSYDLGKINTFIFSIKSLKILIKEKPDFIHVVTSLGILSSLLYKMIRPKTILVFEMHGWGWFETKETLSFPSRLFFLILDILGFIFSNLVIAMSFSQKEFLKKIIKRKRVEVVWGPIGERSDFIPLSQSNNLTVGYLGNSSWWQGLDCIIETAKRLVNRSDIKFFLAGFDFSDKNRFPELSNVIYLGKIKNEEVVSFIKDRDVLLSPRIKGVVSNLQYPQKLSEYFSSGRPVIVSDVSDQRKVIEESGGGMVVSELIPESLEEYILRYKNLSFEEKSLMAKRAFDFAEHNFSFEVFKSKLNKLYISF